MKRRVRQTFINVLGMLAKARGMSDLAQEAGIERTTAYKALGKKGNPRFSTLLGVMKSLGVKAGFHLAK